MEYLNRILGVHVRYLEEALESMPNFIVARYDMKKVTIDGKPAVFVYPKEELEAVSSVKKHMERITKSAGAPAILIPDHLTYRQKEYLLRDRIPFVVDGKQIYLPFMATYLQERGDGEKQELSEILPSAQLLLLYYIYEGCRELQTSEAAQKLGFTATSISRASRQLEEMGLIRTEKRGVQKVILTENSPEEMFGLAKGHMGSPVKRIVYALKTEAPSELLISGYSALSEYTMLNPPMVQCYASPSISELEKNASSRLQNVDDQIEVQLWRYDPRKLAKGNIVDPLSLALALSEDKDERVEEAVEEMLDKVWEDIHGKRN